MINLKKKLKSFKYEFKYNLLFTFLKCFEVLNSPFVRLKFKFYFGKIAFGTPYFYPRRSIKDKKSGMYKTVQAKYFKIDLISLGYKTKWSSDDFRFEWSPGISFVLLKKQLYISVLPNIDLKGHCLDEYWESWLYYKYFTKGTIEERLEQLKTYDSGERRLIGIDETGHYEKKFNIYNEILKKKWIKKVL
jgi:hypothetical protein